MRWIKKDAQSRCIGEIDFMKDFDLTQVKPHGASWRNTSISTPSPNRLYPNRNRLDVFPCVTIKFSTSSSPVPLLVLRQAQARNQYVKKL